MSQVEIYSEGKIHFQSYKRGIKNSELIETGNDHLFVFMRSNPFELNDDVLVVANFDSAPQSLDLSDLGNRTQFTLGRLRDLYSGEAPAR